MKVFGEVTRQYDKTKQQSISGPKAAQRLERLREIAPRLLGIANSNDRVMPPGAMLDALQGNGRDTGVRVENLNLGIHEHPFRLSNYKLKENRRKFIKPFDERYSLEPSNSLIWLLALGLKIYKRAAN